MKSITIQLVALFAAVAASAKITPQQAVQLPPPAAGKVQFTRDIKPIFDASCVKCHGRGKAKGGFSLETRDLISKAVTTARRRLPEKVRRVCWWNWSPVSILKKSCRRKARS